MKKNFVVGLTGGIAGGKTLAADIMAACGAYIIDADVVSREATAPGTSGARALAEAFPAAAKDGGADFDRRRLRRYFAAHAFCVAHHCKVVNQG